MNGIHDREVDDERLALTERIQVGGLQVRHELHVGLVDRLEPTDRRTVEQLAGCDGLLVERARGDVEVLHDAGQIAEADVDELDTLLFDVLDDLAGIVEHISSIRTVGARVVLTVPVG